MDPSGAVPAALQELVHLVVRMFYEPKHAMLVDLLTQSPIEARSETESPAGGKNLSRYYYYIDYGQFINVVKLKLFKIQQQLEKALQIQEAQFACLNCKLDWGLLEVPSLYDASTNSFVCPSCKNELTNQVKTNTLPVVGDSSSAAFLYHKFMEIQTSIIYLLKKLEEVSISAVDIDSLMKRAILASNEEALANTTDQLVTETFSTSTIEFSKIEPETPGGIQIDFLSSQQPKYQHSLNLDHLVSKEDQTLGAPFSESILIEFQGKKVPIGEITEEDLSLMSPEEYESYYLALQLK